MQSVGFVAEIVDIIIAIIIYFSAFALIITQNLGKIKVFFQKYKRKKPKSKPIDDLETKAGEN